MRYIALDTDLHDLTQCKASTRIQIGAKIARGHDTLGKPDIGRRAIEENRDDVIDALQQTDMAFIVCGMGGGTATGAAPNVAKITKDLNILTVAIVTIPLKSEQPKRSETANKGIRELKKYADTLIVIPNHLLRRCTDEKAMFQNDLRAFDYIQSRAVKAISDMLNLPGLMNIDFSEVTDVMNQMGHAQLGFGKASGQYRAQNAVKKALYSHLINAETIPEASGAIVNVTGGLDLTLDEVNEAVLLVHNTMNPNANLTFGAIIDSSMRNSISISVILTGVGLADHPGKKYYHPIFSKLETEALRQYAQSIIALDPKKIYIPGFIKNIPTGNKH
jgi:cell division protein FtsZ